MVDTIQTQIRPYHAYDETALLRTWNAALVADPINAISWRQKVLLDPNFDPEGCLIAEVDGEARGFILALVRQVPFFGDGLQPDNAWITAFGVDPAVRASGLGSALLDATLDRLRTLGRKRVTLSTYVPNYFTPGADIAAYADGIAFLERRGFTITARPLSMRAELTGFRTPPDIATAADRLRAEGIVVRPVEPHDIVPVLQFIRQHLPTDWQREASGVFQDLFTGDPRTVGMVIALDGERVLGYAEHRNERFGPFGVDETLRNRGIGRVLLATMLTEMLKKNYHAAWFLWTDEDAARLYARCGFRVVRRFAVMQCEL